jgi:membrane protein implicated in regulation of membrane protease activity
MLTIAVVIIAIVLVLANLDIVLGFAVLAGMLAIGLAVLAAVIAVIVTWPWIVVGTICFSIVLYFLTAWDINREAKRQTKENQTN